VVGFSAYVEQCRDLLSPAQTVIALPLGAEIERARVALDEAAAGRQVALVCSGDPGVYAMASPLLELPASASADVEVVPGVTAALAAAALLGAPLGHDHAVISLSDLHTPWARIAARLEAAAIGDFVVALYNPRSLRRRWQLEAARDILLAHRPAATPVGLVHDAGRSGQRVLVCTLDDLPVDDVTMTTCVVVGSSTTRMVGGRMVTPRGYFE
jgi:cobalt-precorrin 5A hydrolase/precorrin-3B C17-methyltransferase